MSSKQFCVAGQKQLPGKHFSFQSVRFLLLLRCSLIYVLLHIRHHSVIQYHIKLRHQLEEMDYQEVWGKESPEAADAPTAEAPETPEAPEAPADPEPVNEPEAPKETEPAEADKPELSDDAIPVGGEPHDDAQ